MEVLLIIVSSIVFSIYVFHNVLDGLEDVLFLIALVLFALATYSIMLQIALGITFITTVCIRFIERNLVTYILFLTAFTGLLSLIRDYNLKWWILLVVPLLIYVIKRTFVYYKSVLGIVAFYFIQLIVLIKEIKELFI